MGGIQTAPKRQNIRRPKSGQDPDKLLVLSFYQINIDRKMNFIFAVTFLWFA